MHECARAREHGRTLLAALGADTGVCDRPPRTGLTVPDAARASARAQLAALGVSDAVLLHVGSNGSAADWPIAHMAQLADALAEQGVPVLVSTGLRRPDLEQAMRQACRLTHAYTPAEPSMERLAAWLEAARCVVAGSTGPLHLAGALGTPTVGLFPCVKDCLPAQWGPLGERAIDLVAPEPPTGMVRRRKLIEAGHMRALGVHAVLQAVLRQLGR
jgi:ADP-heptose:LPS heptosyltransferase